MNLNGLGVARVLGRNGVSVVGIHENDHDVEVRTRYLDELWTCGPGEEGLLQTLREKAASFPEPPVLLPIRDLCVRVVARHLDELRKSYRIAMPDAALIETLLDKDGIRETAESVDFPIPKTWFVSSAADLEAVTAFPCILKPAEKSVAYSRAGHLKAYVLDDAEALRKTYETIREAEPRAVVQQYVPGGDDEVYFTLQCYSRTSECLASFTGHKIRQWRPHCGGTASCEPADVPELDALTTRFFQQAGMVGICSIEYKRDPRDGSYTMIEPTVGRTDWQNAVADNNGVPIPYIAYCDLVGEPPPRVARTWLRWRWVDLNSDRKAADYYRRRNELGRLAWLWSIRWPVKWARWAWDDPRPGLDVFGRAWRKLGRILGRKAKGSTG